MDQLFIVIPAYNEARRLPAVITQLKAEGFKNIIVVDDGSRDDTAAVAEASGAITAQHLINRGAGAATQTGLALARLMNAEYVALMDADGQHSPADIKLLYHTITTRQLDIVLGSRFLNRSNRVPKLRLIFNKIANLITWSLSGLYVTDSQSGMKIFSRRALNAIRIQSNGFEFCSEIIRQIGWHHLSFIEVPITVSYSADSMRKGQNLSTGITTFFKLIIRSLMR